MTKNQTECLSWDEYFISIATLTAMRSKDPNTKVGACIVSSDNRVLSVGYNGAPNGFADCLVPWDVREAENLSDTKYPYSCHSEVNAILNFRGNMRELQGARIYVHFFPCVDCTKAIIQAGIKEVIYLHDFDHASHGVEQNSSIRMFDVCGVKYRQFKPSNYREIILSLEAKS